MLAEQQLQRPGRDQDVLGDVDNGDVAMGVLVDEGDRPAQQHGGGVAPVAGGLGGSTLGSASVGVSFGDGGRRAASGRNASRASLLSR